MTETEGRTTETPPGKSASIECLYLGTVLIMEELNGILIYTRTICLCPSTVHRHRRESHLDLKAVLWLDFDTQFGNLAPEESDPSNGVSKVVELRSGTTAEHLVSRLDHAPESPHRVARRTPSHHLTVEFVQLLFDALVGRDVV